MMERPEPVTLFLTRESASSLYVGGLRRVTFWLARPHLYEADEVLGDLTFHHRYLQADQAGHIPGKVFLKLGDEIGKTAWDILCDGAFPGIAYDDWLDEATLSDHLDSIPQHEWIGEMDLFLADYQFEGAVEKQFVVTGPFDRQHEWTDVMEALVSDTICWMTPPRFQQMIDYPSCPFTGRERRAFWSEFSYGARPWLSKDQVEASGFAALSKAMNAAIAEDFGNSTNAVVGRAWSKRFSLWVGAAAKPSCNEPQPSDSRLVSPA